jgi:hypothetical protein
MYLTRQANPSIICPNHQKPRFCEAPRLASPQGILLFLLFVKLIPRSPLGLSRYPSWNWSSAVLFGQLCLR